MDELKLEDGKYTFFVDKNGMLKCNRYDEPWRDFLGDSAVNALFSYACELKKELFQLLKYCSK